LEAYRKYKNQIGRSRQWKNNKEDDLIKLLQSGAILTKGRTGRTVEEKMCKECGIEENLKHLVKDCRRYDRCRKELRIAKGTTYETIIQLEGIQREYVVLLENIYDDIKKRGSLGMGE